LTLLKDLELDETDVDEEEEKKKAQAKPGTYVEPEKPPPEMSAQIEMLLNTLDFNQIDSYRWVTLIIFGMHLSYLRTLI